jgi:uncharacterized protein YbjT (DUF2867 family)
MSKIAVAGATGRVGRHVVGALEAAGHDVVAMSRSTGVDVVTGEGLAEALEGVECIVDAATGPSSEQQAATEFFTASARNLQESGTRAGVRRIVVVSIIGIDKNAGGYGVAKVAHERALRSGPIPVVILRASQFHELAPLLMQWGRQGDVIRVPKLRIRPIAASAVGQALADLATDPTAAPTVDGTPIPEIAGPREESMAGMARRFAARRGDPVRIEEVSDPADPDRDHNANGGLLPGPHAVLAGPTFDEWLDSTS